MKDEIWKPVVGFENIYEVSSFGRVKSLKRELPSLKKEKLLTVKGTDRYERIVLSKGGVKKSFSVHRVVAEAFISNPDKKEQVNHIDGDKKNNNVSNLEWVSASENHIHRYRVLNHKANTPFKGKIGKLSLSSKAVLQYDLEGNLIKRWDSGACITRYYNLKPRQISRYITGKLGKTKNLLNSIWKYE